jgi:hypothetical protein
VQLSECEYCTIPATWILNVQWSVVDFLDMLCCAEHLTPAMTYWRRRTVDGLTAVVTTTPYRSGSQHQRVSGLLSP